MIFLVSSSLSPPAGRPALRSDYLLSSFGRSEQCNKMEASMTSPQPDLTEADAILVAATLFGVEADASKSLGSERDQAFLLLKASKGEVSSTNIITY